MRSEAEISRDMAGKTKCCKYRITDASYSGSCEHPSCGCNANTVPMHKREQRCEHCRGTGRVTAGEQESGLTERQRVAIQFYTDNPRAAEFDFGKRFAAHGVTVPTPVVSLDECCPRCLRDGMVQRASGCKAHAFAHSKSEYKRRTALGDPNVLPPVGGVAPTQEPSDIMTRTHPLTERIIAACQAMPDSQLVKTITLGELRQFAIALGVTGTFNDQQEQPR